MRVILALVSTLTVGAIGCGGGRTSCDEAVDKLRSCGQTSIIVSGSCDARSACEADCINAHGCDEIAAAFAGTPNAYSACDDGCATR